MRIAFDVSYIQRNRAGYGRASEALLRALLARDTENEYILHGWSMSLDDHTIQSFLRPGIEISISHIPGQIKRFYWTTLRFPQLRTFSGPFDIFHGAEPLLPPMGSASAICTVHDLAYLKFPEYFNPAVRSWDRYVRENVSRSHTVIVPSASTLHDVSTLMGIGKDRIAIVSTPSDIRFAPTKQPDDLFILKRYGLPEHFILFVGTIEPRKNIPGLVHAYEELRRRNPNAAPLVIIGKTGWLAEPSLAAINGSPARPHIITPGYVNDNDLPGIFRQASMFVFPSFYEGFGLPVREAMASGVPVITSDNSALCELGKGAALLIDPAHSNTIADAMEILLTDHATAAELRQHGLARAAEFSAEKSVNTVLSIYRAIGGGRK